MSYDRSAGDRRVHAVNEADGIDLVRYDMEGKWFLEPHDETLPRQRVKVLQAAKYAAYLAREGRGEVHTGLYGGARFDYLYSRCVMLDVLK